MEKVEKVNIGQIISLLMFIPMILSFADAFYPRNSMGITQIQGKMLSFFIGVACVFLFIMMWAFSA